ncbi:MAG: transporter permease subunit [Sphingobacterium sp.]|jgi:ABC-2 type transport system permease protein|nr:transporter permease subunit [Sphingobacterium sp.]
MKTIIKIARTELSILFFSPVAWFLLIVFTLQAGLKYLGNFDTVQTMYQGGERLPAPLTYCILSYYSFFSSVGDNLYLYIPLLTMGLISREISSGTIKLLLSSPIKLWEITLGKYLAMMVYGLLLIGILQLFLIMGLFSISSFDTGLAISGLLGLYLLICGYAAIGLFISSLTSYQVVAAIGTFGAFAAISYVGDIWQGSSFFRAVSYFLQLSAHTPSFFKGLISSQDIFYFILIILLFLSLTVLRLLFSRQSAPLWKRVMNYSIVVSVFLLTGYVTSNPYLSFYADWSADKRNTISLESQEILKKLPGPLSITAYGNVVTNHWVWDGADPRNANQSRAFWAPYMRFKPDIDLNQVLYYDKAVPVGTEREIASRAASTYSVPRDQVLSPMAVRKQITLNDDTDRFVWELQSGGRKAILRKYNDLLPDPTEKEIMAAIKRLTVDAPKIAVLTGHKERALDNQKSDGYSSLIDLGIRNVPGNQGFDIVELDLSTQTIDQDLATLVVADPQLPLDTASLSKIKAYINNGGNLLMAAEPGNLAIQPLLRELGVQLDDGVLIQENGNEANRIVAASVSRGAADLISSLNNGSRFIVAGATTLSYTTSKGFAVCPLAVTDGSDTWKTKKQIKSDTEITTFDSLAGDQKVDRALALALTRNVRNKAQKILVFGDADFLGNTEREANGNFILGVLKWYSGGTFPLEIKPQNSLDRDVLVTKRDLLVMSWLYIGVLPALLLLSGTLLLLKRRRM